MNIDTLSAPSIEISGNTFESDLFYPLTTAEIVHLRMEKYRPSEVTIYYYIKSIDPFGHGIDLCYDRMSVLLKYHKQTVKRAVKVLLAAGKLALEKIEGHIKIVAQTTESAVEIISKLRTKPEKQNFDNFRARAQEGENIEETVVSPVVTRNEEVTQVIPVAKVEVELQHTSEVAVVNPVETSSQQLTSIPSTNINNPVVNAPTTNTNSESVIGDIIPKTVLFEDAALKTPQWFVEMEKRLASLGIKLQDVNHALKKYPVVAISAALAYTKNQTWANNKAGVFVNFLKKWALNNTTVNPKSKSEPQQQIETALMKRYPNLAHTLAQEKNPLDEQTLDYLLRLETEGVIYRTQYSTVHNYFGVMITKKDYLAPIPWWEAIEIIRNLELSTVKG